MTDERGAWRTYGEKTLYDSRWVRLGLVDVEAPNGERWDYHVVHFGRIAIAMIVDEDDDTVLMLWRYRFATEQWGYELLGGLVEEGEDPAGTAAREAVEESGWAPVGDPEKLISFEPLPGNVTAPVDVFLWRRAERVGEPTDTEEVGRLEWVAMSRIRGQRPGQGGVQGQQRAAEGSGEHGQYGKGATGRRGGRAAAYVMNTTSSGDEAAPGPVAVPGRSARPCVRGRPAAANEVPVPAQDRRRRDQQTASAASGK